jgi:hypothetical protein
MTPMETSESLSMESKREYLRKMRWRYAHTHGRRYKSRLIEELVAVCGYSRNLRLRCLAHDFRYFSLADLARAALRMTFPASFWSLICASLGFASLLIVQAKPLRELGFGRLVCMGGRSEEQWRGIVYSDIIFAAGFAIFALSDFPPTQRFGLVVLAGLIIDILANLFVWPLLGGAQWKKKPGKV